MKQRNIKRTVLKITVIVFLLWLPVLLITLYYTSSNMKWNRYLDDYEEYYFYRYDYEFPSAFVMDFGTGIGSLDYSRIWFLPSQKDKMLNAIMEDIKNLMSTPWCMNQIGLLTKELSI